MNIKLNKNQWEFIGKTAGWDNEVSAYNLDIHQLLEYANQQTMLDYLTSIKSRLYPGDTKSYEEIDLVINFINQLSKYSKKIKHIVNLYEKGVKPGERISIPEDIDVGEASYNKNKTLRDNMGE